MLSVRKQDNQISFFVKSGLEIARDYEASYSNKDENSKRNEIKRGRGHCGFSIIASNYTDWRIWRESSQRVLFAFHRALFSFSRTRPCPATSNPEPMLFDRCSILEDRAILHSPAERQVVYAAGNKLTSIRRDSL